MSTGALALTLSAEEARVVGSLAEKQLATPQYYPLTLNALVNACNQTNNRDPIVSYDESLVEGVIASLREKGVARLVHPGGGSRVTKYRQVLDDVLGLDQRELALVCVLLLRGPQTLNELKTRTERLADFDGASDVERDLGRLETARETPLVQKLERQAGQKEARYACLLVDVAVAPAVASTPAPAPTAPRLTPLAKDDMDDWQRDVIAQAAAGVEAGNLLHTLVRHPGLARRWLPFGGKLLFGGKLPARLRELLILRTAWRARAAYEWGQHVELAHAAGLTDDEIARVASPNLSNGWQPAERAVLRACDELFAGGVIAEATWSSLVDAFGGDERQLIEVPMVVGHYRMLAGVIASLGVQPEDHLPRLPPLA